MLEALWSGTLSFNSIELGPSVVVFDAERIFGGDSRYYWHGKYRWAQDAQLHVTWYVTHYAGERHEVFGDSGEIALFVRGRPASEKFELLGYRSEEGRLNVTIRLTRLASLPPKVIGETDL
jgi:hypothetical protein